jgi:hypothetical protein
MAKITLDDTVSGFSNTTINSNSDKIETELNNKVLYRDNPSGEANQMENLLDMNSNRIINLPNATTSSEPATYGQLLNSATISVYSGTLREEFSATEGQTVFTLTLGEYVVGANNLSVYVNGVRQRTAEYIETSSTVFTFLEGLDASDSCVAIINEQVETGEVVTAGNTTITVNGVTTNVSSYINNKYATDYADLRTKLGNGIFSDGDHVTLTDEKIAGTFAIRTRIAESDNTGTIITDGGSLCAHRIYDGHLNVQWFGAVGDAITDDSTAIQRAIDEVESGEIPGVVLIPSGTYLCDTGLVVDTSITSIKGDGAVLQFTNLAVNGDAITLTSEVNGYAGGGYYTATNYIEGVRFKGREGASEGAAPLPGQELNCFKIERGVAQIMFGYEIRNCVINNFTISIELGDEAWGTTFRNCNFAFNQTNYYAPLGVAASGAKFLFDACIFQNGKTCFNIENQQGTTYVSNSNIEAMTDNFFYLNGGEFYISNCHIEQAGGHTSSYFFRRDSASNPGAISYLSLSNSLLIVKNTRTSPVFDISSTVSWKISGGDILTGTSTYTGSYFESDGTGGGGGSLSIIGTHFEKGVGVPDIFGGLDSAIDVTAMWNKTPSQANCIYFPAFPAPTGTATLTSSELDRYDEGTWTPTPVSLTVTGSPIYTASYTRIGNTVFGTLTIDPNGGTTASTAGTTRFTGVPYTIKTGEGFAASCITDTTLDQGSGRVEGSSVYPPTWSADSLKRYVTFQYTADA